MEFVLRVYNSCEFDDSPVEYVKVNLETKDVKRILELRNAVIMTKSYEITEFNSLAEPCRRDYDDPADTDEKPVLRELSSDEFRSECMMIYVSSSRVSWTFFQKHGTSLHTTEAIKIDDILRKNCIEELLRFRANMKDVSDRKLSASAQVH